MKHLKIEQYTPALFVANEGFLDSLSALIAGNKSKYKLQHKDKNGVEAFEQRVFKELKATLESTLKKTYLNLEWTKKHVRNGSKPYAGKAANYLFKNGKPVPPEKIQAEALLVVSVVKALSEQEKANIQLRNRLFSELLKVDISDDAAVGKLVGPHIASLSNYLSSRIKKRNISAMGFPDGIFPKEFPDSLGRLDFSDKDVQPVEYVSINAQQGLALGKAIIVMLNTLEELSDFRRNVLIHNLDEWREKGIDVTQSKYEDFLMDFVTSSHGHTEVHQYISETENYLKEVIRAIYLVLFHA